MKIGVLSGHVYAAKARQNTVQPSWAYQGFLLAELLKRQHDVVLLTRAVDSEATLVMDERDPFWHHRFEYAPDLLPSDIADIDVLFVDKLCYGKGEFDRTMSQLHNAAKFEIPCVYHQYAAFPGWLPPFADSDWLLRTPWTIVNRASDPWALYARVANARELIPMDISPLEFATWQPFLMKRALWDDQPWIPLAHRREAVFGYLGLIAESAGRRSERVMSYVDEVQSHGHRVNLYGSVKGWESTISESMPNVHVMGTVDYPDIPCAIASYEMTIVVQHPKLVGLDSWPHRIIENALAGVLQFFDNETCYAITAAEEWMIGKSPQQPKLHEFVDLYSDPDYRIHGVEQQRKWISERWDTDKNVDDLVKILEEACR